MGGASSDSASYSKSDRISPIGAVSGALETRANTATTEDGVLYVPGVKYRAGMTLVELAVRNNRKSVINFFIALSGIQTQGSFVVASEKTTKPPSRGGAQGASGELAPSITRKLSKFSSAPTTPPASLRSVIKNAALMNDVGLGQSKWMPCEASPQVAKQLRDLITNSVRYARGDFPCAFVREWGTFALPYSVNKLPTAVKYLLISELCDTQVQNGRCLLCSV